MLEENKFTVFEGMTSVSALIKAYEATPSTARNCVCGVTMSFVTTNSSIYLILLLYCVSKSTEELPFL